ncbi:MAG: hypothetical protein KBG30_13075 [Bacteroidales bacterium]|jgi:hypothetical protein|nr:hypothetical protein [Bacteroidales bacterium]
MAKEKRSILFYITAGMLGVFAIYLYFKAAVFSLQIFALALFVFLFYFLKIFN